MKNKILCNKSLKEAIDERIRKKKKISDVDNFTVGIILSSVFFTMCSVPFLTIEKSLIMLFSCLFVDCIFMFGSMFYRNRDLINRVKYYGKLSEIFDFDCEDVKKVILEDYADKIRKSIKETGYLNGSLINLITDKIIENKEKNKFGKNVALVELERKIYENY